MLLANNISFKRGSKVIFQKINLTLSPKKIIYFTGKNGSGKTTLLKVLINILNSDSGEIFWNGKNIKKDIFNFYKNITFIMDQQTSSNALKLIENIYFWHKLYNSKLNFREIDSILELLDLRGHKNTYINNLSYGEVKKLELSRLIIEQKKLWILDEPYIGLDGKSFELINQTIKNHAEQGGMVILTSHIDPQINHSEQLKLEYNEDS